MPGLVDGRSHTYFDRFHAILAKLGYEFVWRVVDAAEYGVPGSAVRIAVERNRRVVARLQRRDPAIDTDLGWSTVAAGTLVVRGRGANDHEVAWVGELDAGTTIPLRRPGTSPDWRVVVEEWEMRSGTHRHPPASSQSGSDALPTPTRSPSDHWMRAGHTGGVSTGGLRR